MALLESVVAPALVGAAGTVASAIGQQRANNMARDAAREQMFFQERMSNSAHQREVADLRAAGLNPILSAGGSGAPVPGGASFSPSNELEGVANSALDVMRLRKEIDETESRIRLNDANAASVVASMPKKEVIGSLFKAGGRAVQKVKPMPSSSKFNIFDKLFKLLKK